MNPAIDLNLVCRLAATALLVLVAGTASAQQPNVTQSRGLRIVWTAEPQTRDFTAVCGQIFNDQRVSARNVGVIVESVNGDRVISRNIPNVAREILGQSAWQFCGTVLRGDSYRVAISSVEWDIAPGQ